MALNAVVKDVDADISLDSMVKKNIVKLSHTKPFLTTTQNGNSNMKLRLRLNGSVLEPGKYGRLTNAQAIQTFSENGYKPAGDCRR